MTALLESIYFIGFCVVTWVHAFNMDYHV